MPLADPGFDSTVLSEFRSRLIKGGAELLLLEAVLRLAQERNLLSAGGRQRTGARRRNSGIRPSGFSSGCGPNTIMPAATRW